MPNLASLLNEEIRRLARKEIRQQVGKTIKQVADQRREIAELKRQNAELERKVAFLEKQEKKRLSEPSGGKVVVQKADGTVESTEPSARFSAAWLAKHREKLGFSAADYARLVDCSPLSIYKWERGESTPRAAQREKLASIRGIGKREALKRLELLGD